MENKEMVKKIKKTKKATLRKEIKALREKQEQIRFRIDMLESRKNALYDDLNVAILAKDKINAEFIQSQLKSTKEELSELNRDYKCNTDYLETYSKVIKSGKEGTASILGVLTTAVTVIGTIGGFKLAKESLDKAYKSDMDSTLVNKKTYNVFEKISGKFFGKH